MSNLKISQLPEFSGSTAGSWLIANNAVETGTYKIQRENFLSGYALTSSLNSLSSSIATTDLNQNNTIATLATTSSLTALSSSIASTDLGQNNRLVSIESKTGSYATTGSNVFRGDQTITGSVNISGSLNVRGVFNNIASTVGNYINSNGFGLYNVIEARDGLNQISGAVNIIEGNNRLTGSLISSGSSHRFIGPTSITGSLGIIGNVQITGSAHSITGSLGIRGNVQVSGSTFTTTGSLTVSGSSHRIIGTTDITGSISNELPNGGIISTRGVIGSGTTNLNISSTNGQSGSVILLESQNFSQVVGYGSISDGFALKAANGTGFELSDYSTSPQPFLTVASNISGSNPSPQFKRSLGITGSLNVSGSAKVIGDTTITGSLNVTSGATISGSIITTGSVQGNVFPLTISSNTASLNLNNGNFFTLQLVGGQATHLTPSNIKPGQTVSVFVNTTGSAIMTFPSSIKQMSGSAYTPTIITGLDVLTFISKDSSNLYMVSAKNFI